MNRFYAFGCSFTNYKYATWADILAHGRSHFENWGQQGAGNHFIFNSVMECDQRNHFREGDLVMICWTNSTREDRYLDQWVTPGNVLTSDIYTKKFAVEQVTQRGSLIRDLAMIKAVKVLLESRGCCWQFLSMVPLSNAEQFSGESAGIEDVLDLYKDVIDSVSDSYLEVIYNNQWGSRPNHNNHPLPKDHLEYLERVTEFEISADVRKFVNKEDILVRDQGKTTKHGICKHQRL